VHPSALTKRAGPARRQSTRTFQAQLPLRMGGSSSGRVVPAERMRAAQAAFAAGTRVMPAGLDCKLRAWQRALKSVGEEAANASAKGPARGRKRKHHLEHFDDQGAAHPLLSVS
jgi:hypothetical protein